MNRDEQRITLDAAVITAALEAHNAEPAIACDGDPIVNGLLLRKRLGRKQWAPAEQYGCCGWVIEGVSNGHLARIILTGDHQSDKVNWVHASIARRGSMATYEDLKLLHAAVFADGWAYQVFAPPRDHININSNVLHLFGRADGERVLPDFGRFGTI